MFCFGKWIDSLEVSKIFLLIQSNNGCSKNLFSYTFLGPEPLIVTLHIYLSQFLLTLVQRIWLSVKNFIHTDQHYLCSNSSHKTTFQCPLFQLKKRNHRTAIFNFYLSLGFFSLEFYYLSYLTYSLQRVPFFKVIKISGKIVFMNRIFNTHRMLTERKQFLLHESRISHGFSNVN